MKSAIVTLEKGLKFCQQWLKENPDCSDDNRRVKNQQIKEHQKALDNLTSLSSIIDSRPPLLQEARDTLLLCTLIDKSGQAKEVVEKLDAEYPYLNGD